MSDRRIAAAVERWAHAHRNELIRDLIDLINIRSVACYGEGGTPMGTGCKQALDHFQALAQRYGFATENDRCVSVLLPGKSGERELGILGHLDVVPEGAGWKYEPFAAVEKNGYVIGRGAIDNKGPIIMALYVLRSMRELGISLHSDVRLIAGCDEEKEMRDVQHYLKTHLPPAFTLNCDGAWPVCIGEKGILTADLTLPLKSSCLLDIGGGEVGNMVPASAWAVLREVPTEKLAAVRSQFSNLDINADDGHVILRTAGKAAHCSTPRAGENAIRRLLQILCGFELLPSDEAQKLNLLLQVVKDDEGTGLHINFADKLSGSTTCVPSLLSMKENMLRLHINIRSAITHPTDLLIKRLCDRCETLGLTAANITVSPPRCDSPTQPEIRLLLDTCREFLGRRFQPYVTGGGTHSRLFPRSIPFGPVSPGRPHPNAFGGPHAADEAVCVDELLQGMKVYTAALIRLDRYYTSQQQVTELSLHA